MELITICFLPASQNKSIYQRLGLSGLDYSPAVLQLLSLSSNALIDFTRQPPGIIIWHHILHVIAEYWWMPSYSQSNASGSERHLLRRCRRLFWIHRQGMEEPHATKVEHKNKNWRQHRNTFTVQYISQIVFVLNKSDKWNVDIRIKN